MGVSSLIAGAGGLQAAGAIQQGNAQAAAAGYNAKIALRNADIATQNAALEGATGEANAAEAERQAQQTGGAIKVGQAANNVDVNSGSAKDVQRSQAKMSMLNEMNIRSNAAGAAYGFETKAPSDVMQSQLDRMQQSADNTGGYMRAAGDIISSTTMAEEYGAGSSSKTPFSALGSPPPTANDNWNNLMSQKTFGDNNYYSMAANVPSPDTSLNFTPIE